MLSSALYKLCYMNLSDLEDPAKFGGKIHGPCKSDINDVSDRAYSLKCDKWILQASRG